MAGCVEPFVRLNAESFKDGGQVVINGSPFVPAQLPASPVEQLKVVLKPEWQACWHVFSGITNKGQQLPWLIRMCGGITGFGAFYSVKRSGNRRLLQVK